MPVLLAMVMIMPFEENPYLRIGGDFTMIKLLGIIALVWSLTLIAGGQVPGRVFSSRQMRAFGIFLLMLAIATTVRGADSVALQRMFNVVALLPAVVGIVRREDQVRRLLRASAVTLVVIFPYAYRNALRYGGRLGVGLYEPNYFALIMVLLVPITFVLARQEPVAWKRRGLFFVMGVLMLECALTGSRGGLLGLVFAGLVIVMRIVQHRGLAVLAILAVALAVLLSPTSLGHRLRTGWLEEDTTAGTGAEAQAAASAEVSNEDRKLLLWAGLRMIRSNPITGVGMGRFKDFSMEYGAMLPHIAHNTYLELGGESGLPTLAAYLVFLSVLFSSLRRAGRRAAARGRTGLAELTVAVRTSLAGYCVSSVFLSAQFEKFFWLIVFLSFCLVDVAETGAPAADVTPQAARGRAPTVRIAESALWKGIAR